MLLGCVRPHPRYEEGTITENFNYYCIVSTVFLSMALISSIVMLGTGPKLSLRGAAFLCFSFSFKSGGHGFGSFAHRADTSEIAHGTITVCRRGERFCT